MKIIVNKVKCCDHMLLFLILNQWLSFNFINFNYIKKCVFHVASLVRLPANFLYSLYIFNKGCRGVYFTEYPPRPKGFHLTSFRKFIVIVLILQSPTKFNITVLSPWFFHHCQCYRMQGRDSFYPRV